MYRILVAVDGSETSVRAAEYAANRARVTGCDVLLLHVEKSVMAWEVGPLSSEDTVVRLREIEAARVLVDCAKPFDASIRLERHVATGEAADVILESADKLGANEIVVGSRGLGQLGQAVLGSVASKVVHGARVPVVVVR
jgi:nucleotide-binding universal stress UspA family protein